MKDTIHAVLGHWTHQRPRELDQFVQTPPKWLTIKMRQERERILRMASSERKKSRSMNPIDDEQEVAD